MVADENDATLCANGLDDDYDGRTDCDDPSCDGVGFCEDDENTDAACADGEDNDGDGYVDCSDSGCSDIAACMTELDDAACMNGTDDDMDGDVDCADAGCYLTTVCLDVETVCDDDMDNDMDGLIDCEDGDCATGCGARPLSDFDLSTEQPLLITEIMADCDVASDSDGEYVEVTNMTTDLIDVMGLVLNDNDPSRTATIGVSRGILPGGRLMFVRNTDPTINGGIMNGVEFGFSLNNGGSGDDAAIQYAGTDIHRVTYPGTGNDLSNTGAGAETSQSFNLSQSYIDDTSTTATWCLTPIDAANVYNTDGTDSDYGTPDAANLVCP
jgi:hypothetical protein